jgi:hypothetical protein
MHSGPPGGQSLPGNWRNAEDLRLIPGVRDVFLSRETRHAWPVRVPWSRRQDLHPHWTRSELAASALGYTGMLAHGGPGRTCTVTFRVKAGCSRCLSYRAVREKDAHPGLAPGLSDLQADGSSLHRMRDSESGLTNRTCTGTAAFTGRDATVTTWSTLTLEMVLPRGLAPRTSAFAKRRADSYTSGAWKDWHSMPVLPRLLRRERPLC